MKIPESARNLEVDDLRGPEIAADYIEEPHSFQIKLTPS
jgi:hypothetical protein